MFWSSLPCPLAERRVIDNMKIKNRLEYSFLSSLFSPDSALFSVVLWVSTG
jgi:hypothetical protein